MAETKTVTVEVALNEDSTHTEAKAKLRIGDVELEADGIARRNPTDPNVPVVGEELATARALSDLSHRLLETAAKAIEDFSGKPVDLES
jgi:hypothetical protein